MERRSLLLLCQLVAAVSFVHADPVGEKCENLPDTTCACHHPDGVIDLSPLSKSDGTAMFQNVPDTPGSDLFEYNPCTKFSSVVACQNVFCCQQTGDGSHFEIANDNEQIYIDKGGEGVYAYYTGPADNDLKREVFVTLVCDKKLSENNYTITSTGDSQVTLLYRFTLTTCHACPGGCGGGSSGGTIIGYAGIIIIFLALIALVVYFIVGAVIMKVHYQKEGSEIIPNKGFWFALPVLIKDGFKLTFSPCIKLVKKDKYEPM